MPTVFTHAVLAAAAFSLVADRRRGFRVGAAVAAAVSMLPDIDVMWWGLTTYGAPWGHRGMTHSIAAAAVIAAAAAWACRKRVEFPRGAWGLFAFFFVMTASHGVIDAMTDGGRGVGFLLPFDDHRFFLPLRAVPAAPVTGNPFHPAVLRVLVVEVLLFWPFALVMWALRRPVPQWGAIVIGLSMIVSALTWGWRIAG